MAVPIPQVITPSKASGAQIIDGSLKFDDGSVNFLKRTPSSDGNRQTWTWSAWVKRYNVSTTNTTLFSADGGGGTDFVTIRFEGNDLRVDTEGDGQSRVQVITSAVFRDTGWYHIVVALDTTQGTAADRCKIYVNSTLQSTSNTLTQNKNFAINESVIHELGRRAAGDNNPFDGFMSQVYQIDGQALGPEYFGFTDPLTNTWKPKKYTGTFGTNGFYLPMDGNSPIGKDQSGNGNDWTPVNFGGSVALDNPQVTGARPILNTTQGGSQAAVGVFGSKQNVGYAVTVYNDGGGNKYYIDGVKQDTVTGLIRGATYTFDTSDSTVSSHPFRFSATSNGSHGGGSEYTNGVAAITGAATTITVPHDAPNTLYYYCTSHSGMGADITGITTNEKLADQYASNVVLALPLVSANSDVSASIACTMTNKAITSNGDAAASNEASNFYIGSFEFDGTGDYFTFAPGADFAFGTADFTVECWCYSKTRGTYDYIIDGRNSGQTTGTWTLAYGYAGGNGRLEFASGSSTLLECPAAHNPEAGRWFHVAVTRSGTSLKMFIDGVEVTSATNSTDFSTSPSTSYIGTRYSQQHYWDGYMQDIRVYKGVAKYTSDFVVPSTSPDILPDTPSGVSGSSKLTKITDGAVSFDGPTNGASVGTGYLTIPSSNSSDFNFGTGDFTWEAFVYCDDWTGGSSNDDQFVIAHAPSDNNNISGFFVDGGQSYYYSNKDSSRNIVTGPVLDDKRWYHIAASRESGTLRLFVDGVSVGSASYTDSYADAIFTLGRNEDNNKNQFRGFISNFRVIKGTALYTSRFTPPTEPLTNVTNTKLLCCQSNSSAVNYAVSPGSITANGDTVATNFNPFNTDINTVRGQETGYASLNPLNHIGNGVLSNGNLDVTGGSGTYHGFSTIGVSSGKWYAEIDCLSGGSASNIEIGIVDLVQLGTNTTQVFDAFSRGFGYRNDGYKITNNTATSYGATYGGGTNAGANIGMAVDLDNGTLTFYKNGISQGTAFTGIPSGYTYHLATFVRTSSDKVAYNFGQKPFKFPPPDGFQTLNNANTRPVNVITRPDQYVGVTTYTGDGNSSGRRINIGFRPDLIWLKSRGSGNHGLYDSVRGPDKRLQSDGTAAEDTVVFPGASNFGFDFGSETYYNASSTNYVAWTWKAGGNKNTFNKDDEGFASAAAAGLTAGTITPVGSSVGTKQGFSIIQYQGNATAGAQVPHGLTQTPDFTIIKAIDSVTDGSWFVGGNWAPGYGRLLLHSGVADNGSPGNTVANDLWNNTAPTSSVVTLGGYNGVNDSGDDYIMYNWHNVPGLQKFGTYTGVSALNYVELGFRPALVILKNQSNSSYTSYTFFAMFDSTRDTSNTMQNVIFTGKDQEENKRGNGSSMSSVADFSLDFLSNGFALRDNGASEINLNTNTYVYAAWAEAPTVDLFGGGANAR